MSWSFSGASSRNFTSLSASVFSLTMNGSPVFPMPVVSASSTLIANAARRHGHFRLSLALNHCGMCLCQASARDSRRLGSCGRRPSHACPWLIRHAPQPQQFPIPNALPRFRQFPFQPVSVAVAVPVRRSSRSSMLSQLSAPTTWPNSSTTWGAAW